MMWLSSVFGWSSHAMGVKRRLKKRVKKEVKPKRMKMVIAKDREPKYHEILLVVCKKIPLL